MGLRETFAILVVGLAAVSVLVLGVLELLWPTRPPRGPVYSRRPRRASDRPRVPASPPPAAAGETRAPAADEAAGGDVEAIQPRSAVNRSPDPRAPSRRATAPSPPSAASSDGRLPDPAAALQASRVDVSVLRACRDLYRRERYADTVATALTLLIDQPPSRPDVTAALWSFVGLARQALGDFDGARAAFETAIGTAPEFNRPSHRRYLAALALAAARAGSARAQAEAEPEERARHLHDAVAWARRGLDAAPRDAALREILATTRAALGSAWEAAGAALLEHGDLSAARRVLNEALGDPEVPAGRREALRELLARATPE